MFFFCCTKYMVSNFGSSPKIKSCPLCIINNNLIAVFIHFTDSMITNRITNGRRIQANKGTNTKGETTARREVTTGRTAGVTRGTTETLGATTGATGRITETSEVTGPIEAVAATSHIAINPTETNALQTEASAPTATAQTTNLEASSRKYNTRSWRRQCRWTKHSLNPK